MNLGRSGYSIARLLVAALLCLLPGSLRAQPIEQTKIEAAMTAQLLTFAEWPGAVPKEHVVVGVFEDQERFAVFQTLFQDALYQGRFTARLVRAEDDRSVYESIDAIFFSESTPPRDIARAIKRLENRPVALIGSFDGFLELGGMVNFTKKQKRLGFEIDLTNSRAHGITYRAKLLRLATRLIGE